MEESCKQSGKHPLKINVAIEHFKNAIATGKNWYIALLEAIAHWPEDDTLYKEHLLLGEALDWLSLAEIILKEQGTSLPAEQTEALLFNGQPPVHLSPQEMSTLLGEKKYRQYLNYFYGVIVEEALQQNITAEIRKERMSQIISKEADIMEEAFKRIYEAGQDKMLSFFYVDLERKPKGKLTTKELKEFYYWLFKYRVNHCDKAKVASDTKKALKFLSEIQQIP